MPRSRMYAVVISVSFLEEPKARAAVPALIDQLKATSGFASGYWIELPEEKGLIVLAFHSEDAATAFAEHARRPEARLWPMTTRAVEVGEVLGRA